MSNILQILETAPESIRIAAEQVANDEMVVKSSKLALSVATAKATIQHSEAKNQKLLEALVTQDEDVQRTSLDLFRAEAEVKKSKIALDYEENKFVSARKIGGLDEKVLHSISSSNIA